MTDKPLFLFGTLQHEPLYAAVAGTALTAQSADLADHAVRHAVDAHGDVQVFPLCVAQPGQVTKGLLVRPDAAARARLDAYEQLFDYVPSAIRVATESGMVEALIYQPHPGRFSAGEGWSLDRWAAKHGALTADIAADVMALLREASPAQVRHHFSMLAARVASRRRAKATPPEATLRRASHPDDVKIARYHTPYTWFFGVEEADMQYRRFDGTLSDPINRAGFVMADAVTVMPYDPVRDTVMLVEQFRFGPYVRGDQNPWLLEPIAGRIDAGEAPEEAARRESVEEAHLEMRAMHKVGQYYVSPGAVSEYLFSYIGIADLPDSVQGVHGLASENENIRSHVIPFDRLMALIDSGEVSNGPLIITAQWLALNRERLRGGV